MPWWAWLVVGVAIGAVSYLAVGNALAYRRHRSLAGDGLDPRQAYIAERPGHRTVNFKGEDEVDGEIVGPVFITDDEDPDFLHEVGWLRRSDARELARTLGHRFGEDA